MLYNVNKNDYIVLIEIWEESVRTTHSFLTDQEIDRLKKLVFEKYFDAVTTLKCFKNNANDILGFCGILNKKIEMLFVSPSAQGQGIGTALCQYAVDHYGATKVDVNEQNPRAIQFYKKMGFRVVERSELDSEGQPYPILHMEK